MKTVIIIISSLILLSFSSKKKEKPYPGFDLKIFENSLAYIPAGYVFSNHFDIDLPFVAYDTNYRYSFYHEQNKPKLESFFMYAKEVSNGEYLEFLNDIKRSDTILYAKMLPDTLVWRRKDFHSEALVEYYLRHPTYSNHPVVGVSHAQAMAYCEWLTKKYNEIPNRQHKKAVFKLPTHRQWVYAAHGGLDLCIFPWKSDDLHDNKGQWLANFKVIDQKAIGVLNLGRHGYDNEIHFQDYYVSSPTISTVKNLTMPVESYKPNGFGLFQMAGNVSEYVEEFGITKGGSWKTTGYYLQNDIYQRYDSTSLVSADRGFRFVLEIVK